MGEYRAAGDFPDDWSGAHINLQEAYTRCLFRAAQPERVAGSTVLADVNNMTQYHAFRRGKARDSSMHKVITRLFWTQIESDFTLQL